MLLIFGSADGDALVMELTNFHVILTKIMKDIYFLLVITNIDNYYKNYRLRVVYVNECC